MAVQAGTHQSLYAFDTAKRQQFQNFFYLLTSHTLHHAHFFHKKTHQGLRTNATITGLFSAYEKLRRTCRIVRRLVSTIGFLVSCASTEWLTRGPAESLKWTQSVLHGSRRPLFFKKKKVPIPPAP